jgi:hypothetical protein
MPDILQEKQTVTSAQNRVIALFHLSIIFDERLKNIL